MNRIAYVAFLRGINVGGNNQIKMEELKKVFEQLGFENVKTLLNSGNVLFETEKINTGLLTTKIEETLEKKFGQTITVIMRTITEIQYLIDSDPFKNISVTPQTRLYVTFFSEPHNSTLKIPYLSPEKDVEILRVTDNDVYSVVTISTNKNTTDMMKIIEKEFGKKVTTRNWNTVLKLVQKKN